jgi:hypothetical protein
MTLFDDEPFTRSLVDDFGPSLRPVDPQRTLFSVGKLGEKVSPHVVLCPESHGSSLTQRSSPAQPFKINRFVQRLTVFWAM